MDEIESAPLACPTMLATIDRFINAEIRMAGSTYSWSPMSGLSAHLDVLVESVIEDLRKSDPEINPPAVRRMQREPTEKAMPDHVGEIPRTARPRGMSAYEVGDADEAIAWSNSLCRSSLGRT